MINMDTMKITATKVEITGRNKDDLPGYKNDHKYYKKSDGGFNQKMDQEGLKTYTAAFVIRRENVRFMDIFTDGVDWFNDWMLLKDDFMLWSLFIVFASLF
nr:hypothetical protein [Tanacetum cinerariifolium]